MPEHATILDPAFRDLEPSVGDVGHTRMFARATTINQDERTIDFVCSTATVDRYGEIVEPEAFRDSLKTFGTNPAFPYGHSYDAANGKTPTVGHWRSMRIEGDALVGTAWFKPRDLGEECWLDYNEGNLNTVSVAFLTRAWEMREMSIDGVTRKVRVFTEADLLECSAVLIPANPEARIRAASHAIDDTGPLTPLLKRLGDFLDRVAPTPHTPHTQSQTPDVGLEGFMRSLNLDDAGAGRGLDGDDDLGYFGDIHPTPSDASANVRQVESDELKQLIRDALDARSLTRN